MSETATTPAAPRRHPNWLKLALIASLAVNLLFVGAGVARFYVEGPPERVSRSAQMQLIPRRFFAELERPRRTELLGVFRGFDKNFRDGRRSARQAIAALASALEAEPYDAVKVRAAVESFASQSDVLVSTGNKAALTLIEKLKPEERKLLALELRRRDENTRGAPDRPPPPPPPPPEPSPP
ncbi:periplasmic heavy metal sensor [Aestuariivirga sp.]|uniref:periplasmic heavy metal sensor n=1 Tax=Aestuariivirga sp. TaxID=2650926 RepID=UPI003BAA5C57